jgi:hypothetical protein
MDPITQQTALASAGGKKDSVYVDDVFSTFLFDGNGSTQTITNGIDLSGEGGMVWHKARNLAQGHYLFDTERGPHNGLFPDGADAEYVHTTNFLTAFNSDGYSFGSAVNANGYKYASWTFRKAPGFFDVVTWTGDGTTKEIPHNLGSTPGFVMAKKLSQSGSWYCEHINTTPKQIKLNEEGGEGTYLSNSILGASNPATHIRADDGSLSSNGQNYIAYIFANNDQQFGTDEDESIIKCGMYTGNGTTNSFTVGFEPQWIMIKNIDNNKQWCIFDHMRGAFPGSNQSFYLQPNGNNSESVANVSFTARGVRLADGSSETNTNGQRYIYVAIRHPHKPPESATEVFDPVAYTGNGTSNTIANSLLYTDMTWIKRRTSSDRPVITDRLRGLNYVASDRNDAESIWGTNDQVRLDSNYSTKRSGNATGYNNSPSQPYISWNFKRAPGFFDVVAYTGTGSGSSTTFNHNLTVEPELMIVKCRNGQENWAVYSSSLGATKYLRLESNAAAATSTIFWNNTAPTSSVFTVYPYDGVNGSGKTYVAYLFATLPGISKVGSYTGTGNDINVDCGFTNGARFVMIKRTDSDHLAHWYIWDSARGIVSGNDPYLIANDEDSEATTTDFIDPLNAGFTVTSSANLGINRDGSNFIFLAIA